MDKLKQFTWFCTKDGMPHKVESKGHNLVHAFHKLSAYKRLEATQQLRYITIDNVAM